MTTLLNNEVLPSVDESDNAMSAISESQSTNILANSKEPPDKLKEIDIHVDAPDNFKAIDPHGGSKRRVSFPADLPCSSKSLFENHTKIEENKMENRSKLDTDAKTSAEMKINGNASNGLNTNNDLSQLLALPRPGPRMSCMEEESIRERMRTALLKQCSAILKQGDQKYTKESLRKMFQDKDLLERIFRLFDTERNNYLVQEDWIEFLKGRLTNEKQIELAEQLESAAYVLCGDDVITVEAFLRILQAKGVTEKIFRIVDSDGDGFTTADEVMEFLASVSTTRSRTGFDKTSVEWLEQLFRETVGEENEIRREDFHKIVISKNSFFTERVFQIFDEDNSGAISLQEFIDAMHQFAGKSPEDKIRFLFKVYDLDGDGLIQHRELQHVMRACMEENGMRFSDQQLEELTAAMFEDADVEGRGAITYEALKNQLEKHGGLLENLSISIDRWLVPPKPKAETKSSVGKFLRRKPYQLSLQYFKNNYVFLIFLGAFFVLNAGLFISRAIEYRKSNGFVIVARACGQCLNFNCMWVLVLMLRQSITFLRSRGFSVVLPLDHHIYLHMLTGLLIFGYSVVHTIMHLCNFTLLVVNDPVVNHGNFTVSEWLLTERPGMFGLVGGCANPTGIALAVIILIMFICSHPFIRRKGSFEVFYWTHLLYLPFWLLLIFHGPNFWKWFVVPGLIYIAERISRLAWMRSERGKTYISSGLLLPSKVTHLVIKRPLHFDFHPGDYVFANIPAIATYEWHPFTISSAPEQEEYMWLHIRGVGEWTNRLYEYFEKEHTRLHAGEVAAHDSTEGSTTVSEPLTKLHAQLDRSISNKSTKSNGVKKGSVDFAVSAFSNEAFTIDEDNAMNDSDVKAMSTPRKITPEKKMHLLQVPMKSPLEKSLSMPDMQNKLKKKQRLIALRDFTRSESEKSFDECQMRRAHMKSLGLAYLSPQNKSLAQSFRYMRTKPTIIAFKTPSLEHCEQKASSASIINITRRRLSKTLSPDKDVESGKKQEDAKAKDDNHGITFDKSFSNFPVGKPLEIYLDGPYGAPSSHIFRAQHAVLIATGIGVTPFASILQSIMHRYWKARHCCPKCQHTWASDIPPTVMNLRKVDFFWINREQRSFEWFVSLLSQLEIEQAELGGAMERFLEMHMYITSALQRSDMKAVGLQLALDLLHEKEKRDLITGLKTRTIAGRPNWEKVFKQIQDQKKGKVTVFYCGPPQLARILRVKCDQFGFIFRKEIF